MGGVRQLTDIVESDVRCLNEALSLVPFFTVSGEMSLITERFNPRCDSREYPQQISSYGDGAEVTLNQVRGGILMRKSDVLERDSG